MLRLEEAALFFRFLNYFSLEGKFNGLVGIALFGLGRAGTIQLQVSGACKTLRSGRYVVVCPG